jgi:acetylornithine deacetylase/succinyl-diaminopimelate desuccinylase-like protein
MTNQHESCPLFDRIDIAALTRFAQELIRLPSLSGQERPAVDLCIRQAARLGFDEASFDRLGNFVGRVRVGSGSGRRVILTGHLDTVNADPDQWSPETRPHAASIRDGRLYGRGASDMKAALAGMLVAAQALRSLPAGFDGEVFVVGTVVEELFEGVCFLEALEQIEPDYVIVGEASQCRLNVAQRGRAEILITMLGQGKHASIGRTAINPIEQVAYVIDAFHRSYQCEAVELLGKRNIVPTDIKIPVGGGGGVDGRGGNSTVPSRLELTYDVRTLPGDTRESIFELIQGQLVEVIANAKRQFPDFEEPRIEFASEACRTHTGVDLAQPKFAPAWRTALDAELVVRAQRGLAAIGLATEPSSYKFCTDGSGVVTYLAAHPDRSCQVIGFGPSRENLAHVIDEYIELEELQQAVRGWLAIATELLRV